MALRGPFLLLQAVDVFGAAEGVAMRFHYHFYIGRITAAHGYRAGNAMTAQRGKHQLIPLSATFGAHLQLAKFVGIKDIDAR